MQRYAHGTRCLMQTPSASSKKVKFAAQPDSERLNALRTMPAEEDRQLPALVDEALHDSVARKDNTPRKHVVQALHASMAQFDSLYRELSK